MTGALPDAPSCFVLAQQDHSLPYVLKPVFDSQRLVLPRYTPTVPHKWPDN